MWISNDSLLEPKILLCGGMGEPLPKDKWDWGEKPKTPRDACYELDVSDENSTWTEVGALPSPVLESGYAYHPSWGLVISGGLREDDLKGNEVDMANVVVTKDGRKFEELAPLPVNLTDHCLAIVDDDRLFVTGGETGGGKNRQNRTYIYSKSAG